MTTESSFRRVRNRLFVGGTFDGKTLSVVDEPQVELDTRVGSESYSRRVLYDGNSPCVVFALSDLSKDEAQRLFSDRAKLES